ncbi:MAPEG family protein [Thalassotalea euphylliae]|uniref:MAPEG family protein n=1 Tax=Thalassotalea euphylliae TaxID=1655234 RepID=UPI00363D8C62
MNFSIEITALYASILAILFVALAFNVIRFRFKYKVGLGAGEHSELDKAIRIHGNFAEYMPLAMLLMAGAELSNVDDAWLHIAGITFVVGRLLHTVGLTKTKGTSMPRFIGMISTFICMLVLAIVNIIQFFAG